jgi:TetR/AcrR family transcriptional repressor of nem operon
LQFILREGHKGHSRPEKAKTYERMIKLASMRFREEGLAGIGIADLMKEAGLTVGGFYKHCKSRDDLSHPDSWRMTDNPEGTLP